MMERGKEVGWKKSGISQVTTNIKLLTYKKEDVLKHRNKANTYIGRVRNIHNHATKMTFIEFH